MFWVVLRGTLTYWETKWNRFIIQPLREFQVSFIVLTVRTNKTGDKPCKLLGWKQWVTILNNFQNKNTLTSFVWETFPFLSKCFKTYDRGRIFLCHIVVWCQQIFQLCLFNFTIPGPFSRNCGLNSNELTCQNILRSLMKTCCSMQVTKYKV